MPQNPGNPYNQASTPYPPVPQTGPISNEFQSPLETQSFASPSPADPYLNSQLFSADYGQKPQEENQYYKLKTPVSTDLKQSGGATKAYYDQQQAISQVNPVQNQPASPQTYNQNTFPPVVPNQYITAPESQNFPTAKIPQNPELRKTSKIRLLARIVAIFVFVSLITGGGLVGFAILNPENTQLNWLTQNTPLKNLKDQTVSTSNSSQSSSSSEISRASNQNQNFEFSEPKEARTVVEIVEDVLPSVLSISLKSKGDGNNINQDISSGTGYIATADGLVLTNKHVVSSVCKNDLERVQITALTHDQRALNLKLLSIDPIEDLAILKIEQIDGKLPTVDFLTSDNLKLGQEVIAIGNVLGELQNTVTRGIVSGLSRSFETTLVDPCTNTEFQADNLIQTDAAINRGNSGGPLFGSTGQLIGMNTLGTTDAQNIGLAIPTNTLKTVLESFVTNNQIIRARLGVTSLQINSLRKAQNSWIPVDYGEIVFSEEGSPVSSNSAAQEAGIKEGDIILEIDGKKLTSTNNNPSPLRREILSKQPETKIKMNVLKATNKSPNGFTYEQNPVIIEVNLGSVYFDLRTKEVIAT